MANAFLPSTQQAGVAYQVHYLANTLVERGHHVTVFTCSPLPLDAAYAVHTFRIPRMRPRLYAFAQAAFLASVNLSSFDVLHVHGDNYLRWRKPAQVRTFHGSAIDEAQSATSLNRKAFYLGMACLETLGARAATLTVAVSEATRARFRHIDSVIPCGVDLQRFYPGEKSLTPSILFVGGLTGRKRGELLIDAFAHVRTAIPDAELWLVTSDIPRTTTEGMHVVRGPSSEVLAQLYRRAWIFCMPSSYEGFGVPYVEAMASGTAVVSTPNAGALEVLQAGRDGVIVDDKSLASTLRSLLLNDSSRAEYVNLGLRRAQLYGWPSVAAMYEAAYETATTRVNRRGQ